MAADADDDGDDDWNMKSNVRIFSRIIYSAKEIDELVSVWASAVFRRVNGCLFVCLFGG